MYDIFYIGDNTELKEKFPFSRQIDDASCIKSNTALYWLVESNTSITDWDIFEFKPDQYTVNYEHKWKWNDENYGGVVLLPKTGSTETVFHNKIVCKKQFDILLQQTPEEYFDHNEHASHVWCVDPQYVLGDDINWAPGNFEPDFIHCFHLRGQLEHKYPELEGGIKLYPRNWESAQFKYHKFLDASADYPIMYVSDIADNSQRDIYKDDYVWLIDKDHSINDSTVDWVPNPFEKEYIHCFKMPYQLKEKYPMAMGGIKLVPRNWKDTEIKIHPACPIEDEAYDVFYIDDDEFNSDTYNEYSSRSKTEWFWIVDRDFTFNGKLLFVPAEHEQEYIHVFKIPDHLEERYPRDIKEPWDIRCGGVRLVNKQFDMTKHKYQEDIVPVRYDIFYVDDLNDYNTPARKSRTKMFWMIDTEHQINEEFKYVPQRYDQKCIQVFKFPGDLEHKYPRTVTNISDNRAGGIKLVPVNGNGDAKFIDQNPVGGKLYPIRYTDQTDVEVTEDSWIVPEAFKDNITAIPWQPSVFEKNTQHVFASGLLRWQPIEWNGEIKEHDFSPVIIDIKYEVFSSYEEGKHNSKYNWFWVVDPQVTVLDDFDWQFQPNVFDEGKPHVWQKLNPITNKQYDYGGVELRHKSEKKGRPKYIREHACVQNEYPVYQLTAEDYHVGLKNTYDRLAAECSADMFWVVDAFVEVYEDFDYSYYPTQYDKSVVHVWKHKGATLSSGVRLIPKSTEFKHDQQIVDNSFEKLKQLPQVASKDPIWPLVKLQNLTAKEIHNVLSNTESDYVWTLEPGIELDEELIKCSYLPHYYQFDVVHVWKNQGTDGYGGLRLWPKTFSNDITDEQMSTCNIPNQFILDSVAGPQKQFPVYFLSHNDYSNSLVSTYNKLAERTDTRMFWVVDANVRVDKDFDFGFMPTQFDMDTVHVWEHNGDTLNSAIKLLPKNTVFEHDKQILENSFHKLKTINTVASSDEQWPVVTLSNLTVAEVKSALKDNLSSAYVWTHDVNIELDQQVIDNSYLPHYEHRDQVHVWKNADTEGYGGLRLWPTDYDVDQLTDEQVLTCSIPDQFILDSTAGAQKRYPVYYLTAQDIQEGLKNTYQKLSAQTETRMFWVVDAFVQVNDDFEFTYTPSQFDTDVVHVWKHASTSRQTGVRLMPTSLTYDSDMQINDNSFAKLKMIPTVASHDPVWPVEQFDTVCTDSLQQILKKHSDNSFVWTVDPDIELDEDVITQSIIPHINNVDVVHVWKRTNSEGLVVGHGGLRLWPTWFPAHSITDEQLITSSVPDQLILDSVAGPQKEFPILELDPAVDILSQLTRFESQCDTTMYWCVDPYVTYVDDWKFDYIPTKWEEHVVHVFLDTNDETRSVRLIPNGTFTTGDYTVKHIVNNSFEQLKVVYRHATRPTVCPVYGFNTETSANTTGKESLKLQLEAFSEHADGKPFFTVDSDVFTHKDFDYAHTPQLDSVNSTHVWQRLNPRTGSTHSYGGVRLWPNPPTAALKEITSDRIKLNRMDARKLQYVKKPASSFKPYNIVMLSYQEDEQLVEQRIQRIQQITNETVIHVRGVKGIFSAHQAAASKVNSSMFWVVDADAHISDGFDFSYIPDAYDHEVVHVWASENPVTGLEYGYGGVKLFNTQQVLDATTWGLDFTTGLSNRFKSMPQVSCVTAFNTDEFSTWRSAFRESVKLALSNDSDSKQRLDAWLNPLADAQHSEQAKQGAEQGRAHAMANSNNISELEKINDYDWLQQQWSSQ